MFWSNNKKHSRLGLVLLVSVAAAALGIWTVAPGQSEPSAPSNAEQKQKAWIDYVEACQKLADADLAVAESESRRVQGSVSEYDLQRLQLRKNLLQKATSLVRQSADFGEIMSLYAEEQSQLANLDLKSAEEARRKNPGSVSDAQLERIRCNAEVCRLRMALAREPVGALSIIDHLHWETHSMMAEIMRLNRRVARLEEIALR